MENPEDYRFERKFSLTSMSLPELELMVKLHPALFSEIFWPRKINNIYFDDFNMHNLDQNIAGTAFRTKVRIRWYGELMGEIAKPVLEFKIKHGNVGKKRSYKLAPFELKKGFSRKAIRELFEASDLPQEVKAQLFEIHPVIINQYKRKYFLSADKEFRITIDWNLKYVEVNPSYTSFMASREDNQQLVMELKYSQDSEEKAHEVSSRFPFRMTKNSKYVNGLNSFHHTF